MSDCFEPSVSRVLSRQFVKHFAPLLARLLSQLDLQDKHLLRLSVLSSKWLS